MNTRQLKELITSVLKKFDNYSAEAVDLLMLTAAQESHCGEYIQQLGGGPALGIFQMEPATLDDIWENYIHFRNDLGIKVKQFLTSQNLKMNLCGNLLFQIVIARVHYMRVSAPIPERKDFSTVGTIGQELYVMALADYWKRYWNTEKGAGTAQEAFENFYRYINEAT